MTDKTMTGIDLIAAERARQIEIEGFDATHDDDELHRRGELAMFACYYAVPAHELDDVCQLYDPLGFYTPDTPSEEPLLYPENWSRRWAKKYDKPRIKQLVIAGALIAAEIDRLRRLEGE